MPSLTCHIAGIPHRKPDLSRLQVGETVFLHPEPENKFDPNAIKVLSSLGAHLGYIPKDYTGLARTLKTMTIKEIVPSRKWSEVIIYSEL